MAKNKNTGIIIAAIVIGATVLSCSCCSLGVLFRGKNNTDTLSEPPTNVGTQSESTEAHPNSSYTDNIIGETVYINGLELTINSIQLTKTWNENDSYELDIHFKNNTDSSLTLSPYDWHSVSDNGDDVAHVGGDTSFHLNTLKKGEEWDAKLTLWNENAVRIKYDSKLTEDNASHPYVTWIIPGTNADSDSFILKSGVEGDYGKTITLNASTDMPVNKILYKLPAGKYKVTSNTQRSVFSIVKDEITIEEGNNDYPETLDYVSDQYLLTNSASNDFNGTCELDVTIELKEDESISIPTGSNDELVFRIIK